MNGEDVLLENLAPSLVLLMAVSVGLTLLNGRLGSPRIALLGRWLRWVLISLGAAFLLKEFGWVNRSFWLVAAVVFLLWLLLETIYNWLAIGALSRGAFPLFPHFQPSHGGDDWPAQPALIRLKEWLGSQGFRRVSTIKAHFDDRFVLRSSIFHSPDEKIRLQVLFIPLRRGNVTPAYILTSSAESGQRLITDNSFLPFGGFYPVDWLVERKPLKRSLASLLRRHRQRMEQYGLSWVSWDEDALGDLNQQQRHLEKLNTELGFLFPRHLHDEHGMLTWGGRYRVWQELWMLSYFGRPRH